MRLSIKIWSEIFTFSTELWFITLRDYILYSGTFTLEAKYILSKKKLFYVPKSDPSIIILERDAALANFIYGSVDGVCLTEDLCVEQ
jgi:hypothetical protein